MFLETVSQMHDPLGSEEIISVLGVCHYFLASACVCVCMYVHIFSIISLVAIKLGNVSTSYNEGGIFEKTQLEFQNIHLSIVCYQLCAQAYYGSLSS